MAFRKFFIILGIVLIVFVTVFITLPALYMPESNISYGRKNDSYLNDYLNLPLSIEASLRLERDIENRPLVYLDMQITNNSKKTINAIDIYVTHALYTMTPYGNTLFMGRNSLQMPQPLWKGIKCIRGYSTTHMNVQLNTEVWNYDTTGLEFSRVECELYITWIRYAWNLKPWGNGYLSDNFTGAPQIHIPTFVA